MPLTEETFAFVSRLEESSQAVSRSEILEAC